MTMTTYLSILSHYIQTISKIIFHVSTSQDRKNNLRKASYYIVKDKFHNVNHFVED